MYRRRTTRAGKTLEIEKYTCTRMECGKRVRGPKRNPTPEDMKAVNERNAQRRLTWIINENFSPGDIHMILTYQDPAPEKEEAKTELSKFIRELRKIYKKAGTELKYITVTEYHGKRIHHHLLLSAIDTRLLRGAWTRGRPKITFLDESGSYWRLAGYFRKELRRTGEGGEEADLHQPELKASGTGVPGDLSQELPKRAGSEDPAQGRRVLSGRFQAVGKVYR